MVKSVVSDFTMDNRIVKLLRNNWWLILLCARTSTSWPTTRRRRGTRVCLRRLTRIGSSFWCLFSWYMCLRNVGREKARYSGRVLCRALSFISRCFPALTSIRNRSFAAWVSQNGSPRFVLLLRGNFWSSRWIIWLSFWTTLTFFHLPSSNASHYPWNLSNLQTPETMGAMRGSPSMSSCVQVNACPLTFFPATL